jgi:predicted lipoprotein with Yx(FWY)xxD motif
MTRRTTGAARTPLMAVSALAIVAVVASACSSTPAKAPDTNSPAITTPSTSASAGSGAATVTVASSGSLGSILTTPAGLALYTYASDHNGMASCTGSCAQEWPPLTVASGTSPTAPSAVTGTLAAVKQSNGTYQVTYNGSPPYTFVSDSSGHVTGNGVGGFSVVKVSGTSSTPTTAASGSGGGSGY